jgi:hypothetical protein
MKIQNKDLLLCVLNCTPKELRKLKKLFKKLHKYNITVDEVITTARGQYITQTEPLTYGKLVKTSFYMLYGLLLAYFYGRAKNAKTDKELNMIELFIEKVSYSPNLKKLKFGNLLDDLPLDGDLSEDYDYFIYLLNQKP